MKTTATPPALAALPPAATATPGHPLAAVAPATTTDRAPEENAATARRFAELLRARRSDAAAPPPAAAPQGAAPVADVAPKPDASEASAAPEPVEPRAGAPSRSTSVARPGTPIAKHATAKATVPTAADRSEADPAHDEPGSRALVAAVMPGDRSPALALLAAQPAAADAGCACDDPPGLAARARDDGAVATDAAASGASQGAAPSATFGARGKVVLDAAGERGLAAASAHPQPSSLHAEATFASALGEVLRAGDGASSRTARPADAAVAPIAAGSVAAAPGEVRDVAPPATPVALATPIDAPDFAAALGVQVSVLARDGVQRAELHLHPIETGPVSIRIEVDGTHARIDFGADLAATRHAIEQGLPELASALRDAGLTLAGGGVSQHADSRPRGDEDGGDAARARAPLAAPSPAAAPARPVQRRIAAGGVDLYA